MEQHIMRRLVPVEVKEVADRTLEIAGSTEEKDRMGDIVHAGGWKLGSFKKNPVFMWAHRYDDPPIGRAVKVWVDKETSRLMFNVEFAGPEIYEFADTIFKLYKGGFLHATSVGFIPLNWEGKGEENPNPKWEGNIFTSQELLELSAVPVPANANALVSARDKGFITVKEFDAVTKPVDLDLRELPHISLPPLAVNAISDEGVIKSLEDVVTKPEETEDWIRIPVSGEGDKHGDHRIRTIVIDEGKGIRALYCGECKVIITYLFDKDKGWTIAVAQEWVDRNTKGINVYHQCLDVNIKFNGRCPVCLAIEGLEHKSDEDAPIIDGAPKPIKGSSPGKKITQIELADELDYVTAAIIAVGISSKQMPTALSLAGEIIKRATGADIPDDIRGKVGAVLNAKNRDKLTSIQRLAQEILDSAEKPLEEGGKQVKIPELQVDPVKLRAQDVAEVTHHVLSRITGRRIK